MSILESPPRWELLLDLPDTPHNGEPKFLSIARSITRAVRSGRLRRGTRLPGSRTLAESLCVHRNTVLAAYDELVAEGWLETVHGKGTFVARSLPEPKARRFSRTESEPTAPQPKPFVFELQGPELTQLPDAPPPSQRADGAAAMRPPYGEPELLKMYGGVPDLRLLPKAALARAYRRQLRRAEFNLGYGDPWGTEPLRAAIAEMLSTRRGLTKTASDVLVTRGSQMALALVARALVRPGDRVAVEQWGYRPAWEAFRLAGAELVPIPVDRDGLDLEALETASRKRLAFVYVTPHHQYPTMAALSPGRRLALLELSRQRGFPIVEDDFDHEYHYDGRPLLPLASADSDGRVVYVGTLSKVLAPGLRIGYLVAARQLLERVAGFRGVLDHQGDAAWDGAIAELIEDGELQRHLSRTRRIYRARRDHVCALLDDRLGHVLDFDVPAGGMALWARARDGCDVERWERQGRERGVGFLSGRHYHFDGASQQFLRLGYACLNEAELTLGVERLEAALPRRRAQNGPSKRRSSP